MGLFGRKKKSSDLGYDMPVMRLQTDIHSHVLPGIDDGAANLEESLEMIKAFIKLGYTKIIVSPHVHSMRYKNTTESIRNAYNVLIEGMKEADLHLQVEFAAEYHLDNEFLKIIKDDDILSISDSKYVLIEFPFRMPPLGVDMVYQQLKEKGYQPVVAHPERYEYWQGNPGMFERLRSMGYLFQCNIHSAAGAYGPIPVRLFEMMANNNWIDFLGSDAHSPHAVSLIDDNIKLPVIQKAIMSGLRNHSL